MLIKNGANINYRNPDGINALFIAVLHDNVNCTLFLFQNNIDDTIQDKNGNTALILACAVCDNYSIIGLL